MRCDDLGRVGRVERAGDEFAVWRERAIAEGRHGFTAPSSRAGPRRPRSPRRGTWRSRRPSWSSCPRAAPPRRCACDVDLPARRSSRTSPADVEGLEHADAAAIADAAAALAAPRLADRLAGAKAADSVSADPRRNRPRRDCVRDLQRSQSTRTSRCATTEPQRRFEQERLDAEIEQARQPPRRRSRCAASSARDGRSARRGRRYSAVSASRTSPTMMTSGSWRTKARIAAAKVRPIAGFTCDWHDAGELVFDRVLDGQDLARRRVERATASSRASSSCRCRSGPVMTIMPCGKSSARRIARSSRGRKPELRDLEQAAVARQQANDGGFAVLGRHAWRRGRRSRRAPTFSRARAVLRQPPLGDVEAGENLDARDQRLRRRVRRRGDGPQQRRPRACAPTSPCASARCGCRSRADRPPFRRGRRTRARPARRSRDRAGCRGFPLPRNRWLADFVGAPCRPGARRARWRRPRTRRRRSRAAPSDAISSARGGRPRRRGRPWPTA